MRIRLDVTNDLDGHDHVYEVVCDNRDVRQYEATFSESWISSETTITQLTQLAWITSRRMSLFDGDYAAFDKVNVDVRSTNLDMGEVDSADPT